MKNVHHQLHLILMLAASGLVAVGCSEDRSIDGPGEFIQTNALSVANLDF